MKALFVALRAVHYASAILLFGELVFLLVVASPVLRLERGDGNEVGAQSRRRFFTVARWSLVASLASGAGWFGVETVLMSGLPAGEAMTRGTLDVVLGNTEFGHIFALRLLLVLALAAAVALMRRPNDDARRSPPALAATVLAAAYLGSLAWVGHAVAGDESGERTREVADVLHLLAAGAWLGALPAFAFALGREPAHDAALAAGRFSTLGVASVAVLVGSGIVNTWYQVGDIPALAGTDYGRLLILKVSLFAAMLGLAAVNRNAATEPRAAAGPAALRMIRRNATLEIALGIGVLAMVGVLGVTVPATHQPPVWPFDRTLTFDAIGESAWLQLVVAAVGTTGCIAALWFLARALGRPPRLSLAALAAVLVSCGILMSVLGVPAHPTTYVTSPVRYTADAIAAGSVVYAASCSGCHGRSAGTEATGERQPLAGEADLADRVLIHREGDLYWSIAHGVAGTSMPAFGAQQDDTAIWSVIQYLDAEIAARNAAPMSDQLRPLLPVPAPDFTYELAGEPQQSLSQPQWPQRGNRVALLVLYTLPASLPRLRELAALERSYGAAGSRVIAIPMSESPAATAQQTGGNGESMLAAVDREVAATYLMFARAAPDANSAAPTHVEYLIDRFGFVRVRWIGVPEREGARGATLGQIDVLAREPAPVAVRWGHRH